MTPRRRTWGELGRVVHPELALAVILCAVAAVGVVMLALSLGAAVHPGVGWLVVALGAGVPGGMTVRHLFLAAQLERERRDTAGRTEHSRVEEALGPVEPSGWGEGDDDGPARAPRPGWRT